MQFSTNARPIPEEPPLTIAIFRWFIDLGPLLRIGGRPSGSRQRSRRVRKETGRYECRSAAVVGSLFPGVSAAEEIAISPRSSGELESKGKSIGIKPAGDHHCGYSDDIGKAGE